MMPERQQRFSGRERTWPPCGRARRALMVTVSLLRRATRRLIAFGGQRGARGGEQEVKSQNTFQPLEWFVPTYGIMRR